jgi:hypothetical protein
MHPSPDALMTMTNDELLAYRAELSELEMNTDDVFNAYSTRKALIDAILSDRKRNAGLATPEILDAEADDAATIVSWSDREPATIIKRTAKTITVQRDRTAHMSGEKHDAYAHGKGQVVVFQRDTDAPEEVYTLRDNGRWKRKGEPKTARGGLIVGRRDFYRDPSF